MSRAKRVMQICNTKYLIQNESCKYLIVLGTCATFSATAPLARTKKGGARRGGANVKNNSAVAVARKKCR